MTTLKSAQEVLARAVEHLAARPGVSAVLVREPLLDAHYRATSDIDLMVFAEAEDLLPERLHLPDAPDAAPSIDLITLPRKTLEQPAELARKGLVPHRLLGSRLVYDRDGDVAGRLKELRLKLYEPGIHADRITGFLDMGFYTVREVGVTWDFPALALFWLHVGHAACLAAMADGLRRFCPNVYTRPFEYCRELERLCGVELVGPFVEALHLGVEPRELIAPLKRVHATVAGRFPEPEWPANMRHGTRYEYRYFGSAEELRWRVGVAEEMARRGDGPAAVFYLRFWAYSLARLPMVYQRANEGIDVSFMRPERAVRAELEKHCPEILDDLAAVLAPPRLTAPDVSRGLEMLSERRAETLSLLNSCGVELPGLRTWQPAAPVPSHTPPHTQPAFPV
jgi:hypothetical protein